MFKIVIPLSLYPLPLPLPLPLPPSLLSYYGKVRFLYLIKIFISLQSKGIDPSIFTIPEKFHLTIGMMTLLTENEVVSQSSLLRQCANKFE